MAKENPSKQRSVEETEAQRATSQLMRTEAATRNKGKNAKKPQRSQIGGTAVAGAKSTQVKQIASANNAQQQQYESYNRSMRRRMDHIGTGPKSDEERTQNVQKKRQQNITQRKQRLEERRSELSRQMPDFNRRVIFFAIGAVAIVVAIIVIFVVLRITGVMH